MNWYVLHVKTRNEKKIAKQLQRLGVQVYCPTYIKLHQWSDRKKKIETPLFSSYVFVKLQEHERNIVFEVPNIFRYLYWLGKPAVVRENEILVLKNELKETIEKIEVTYPKKGDLIDISSGVFKGKQGIVSELNNKSVKIILKEFGVIVRLRRA